MDHLSSKYISFKRFVGQAENKINECQRKYEEDTARKNQEIKQLEKKLKEV